MIGTVGKVRELTRGVEAEVTIGATGKHGYVRLRVLGTTERTRRALEELKSALRAEAHDMLVAAQQDTLARKGSAIGVVPDEKSECTA